MSNKWINTIVHCFHLNVWSTTTFHTQRDVWNNVHLHKMYNITHGHVLWTWNFLQLERVQIVSNGAFPLHGTVRFGTVRYGSVRVGLHLHRSLVPLKSGRDYSRVVIIAPPLLPWRHRKRATNKLTTKKGDGIVFFTLGMWMFLTTMERSMNACDLPPAAETVVAVPRAVTLDEESRDVRAGVLRYLIS